MNLSGHRNEGSIRSYCRDSSNEQKRQCSDILMSKINEGHTVVSRNTTQGDGGLQLPVTVPHVVQPSPAVIARTQNAPTVSTPHSSMFNNCNFGGSVHIYTNQYTSSSQKYN
jgi:hypothetical protein